MVETSLVKLPIIWMWLDFTDDQLTLVQVMAWCHQATSHYLSQCWPRSLSPYGIIRPQWVKQYSQDVGSSISPANNKGIIKALHHWPFVRGIHQSLVDSLHKGPVVQSLFQCHDSIMLCLIILLPGDECNYCSRHSSLSLEPMVITGVGS